MNRSFKLRISIALLFISSVFELFAQQSPDSHPPDYQGVQIHIPGVFVTPIPGAPFSGIVEIVSTQPMPDGSMNTRRTVNHIARNSLGVIYNERRKLEPPDFDGEPPLFSSHIYDPRTRLSTFLNPATHLTRQMILQRPLQPPGNTTPATASVPKNAQNPSSQDLGSQTIAGVTLRGIRKLRIIPASLSGTGRDVTITDDYWYSDDLKIYLVLKHNDPRTGEQIVGVTKIDRQEPDASIFQIPAGYKVVDETPAVNPAEP